MIRTWGIHLYLFLASAPLPDPSDLRPPATGTRTDPLIDKGGELTVSIGAVLLVIGIAALVGVFSRRIEYAVFTALILSIIPIALFTLGGH